MISSDLINQEARITPLGGYGAPYVGARRGDLRMPLLCHLPLYDSPAIGGGINTNALTTELDQRGNARTFSASGGASEGVDIGSIEASRAIVVNTALDQFDTPSGSQISLREALRDGKRIVIDPSLSGETLTLSNGQYLSPSSKQHFIEYSLRFFRWPCDRSC